MDLNEIYVFCRVVEMGSFSRASRALGMPNSTVSAKVANLERRLGTTLIQRTTRRLTVTATGRKYYERCATVLREFRMAEVEVTDDRDEPRGLLRMTAPVELGNVVLPSLLTEYQAAHPRVSFEALLTDRRVDLVEEGYDLALRAGELADSSLLTKRIAEISFGLFASPAYLVAHGIPQSPAELPAHRSIRFTPLGGRPWSLQSRFGGEATIECPATIFLNDLNLVKSVAERGAGLALLPTFFCAPEIEAKSLARVLPEWTSRPAPLQFVYPAQKFVPVRVHAFIDLALPVLRRRLTNPDPPRA